MRLYKFLTREYGLQALCDQRLKISRLNELNDPFELMAYYGETSEDRLALKQLKEDLNNKGRGLLCFSANWTEPLLWSHYADNHKGICLGFEVDVVFEKVKYISERMPLPAARDSASMEAMAYDLLFTKFENWRYEQEFRCWTTLEEPEGKLYFMNFSDRLRCVEVLAQDTKTLYCAEKVARASSRAIDVKLARLSDRDFRFELHPNFAIGSTVSGSPGSATVCAPASSEYPQEEEG